MLSAILEPTLLGAVFVLPPRQTIMTDGIPRCVYFPQRDKVLVIHTSLIIKMMCSLERLAKKDCTSVIKKREAEWVVPNGAKHDEHARYMAQFMESMEWY